ncbi:MAG: aminotransferase class V-fold PLP-dependent enzyme [Steroidobacteraceae bacterium]|jgi:cysteine desulfurase
MNAPAAYLDYAATTPVAPEVAARMAECLTAEGAFGNPSSGSHAYGARAAALVEAARAQVAACVGAEPAEVIWTSGATEANNLAIFGAAHYYRGSGNHIVTARTEHKSVLDPCRELERRGWRVTYLSPGPDGVLQPGQIAAALESETVLVSIMQVNNEIGAVQDVAAIAQVCAESGKARLHVDAAQSVGKVGLDFAALGVDLLSLSAHKVYGPKGIGALLVSRRRAVQLTPLLYGGGQERSLRSGTIATHQAVGMGAAFALAGVEAPGQIERIGALRELLWRGISGLGGVHRNSEPSRSVPHILNVSFEGVEGESLLAAVSPRIAVSTGSACTSAQREPSYVLRALGRDDRLAESSLRFSLGRYSTAADIDTAVDAVTRAVTRLRRIGGA